MFDTNNTFIPTEVVTVTATQVPGHIILGMKDRQGDTAAVVLNYEQIEALLFLIRDGVKASVDGVEFFKGLSKPVLERPDNVTLN